MAGPQVGTPAPQMSFNLNKALKDCQTWLITYVTEKHQKDISDVIVVGVPGFKAGGGGLYCKTDEPDSSFLKLKEGAINGGRLEKETDKSRIVKGKFLLVKSDAMKVPDRAAACFIMWHEFGHALADRGVGSNVGEKSAWKFELESITEAKVKGKLPQACTDEIIRAFVDCRKLNYADDQDLGGLATTLLGKLSARPAKLIDSNYLQMTKSVAVNNLGDFDTDKFKLSMKKAWPHAPNFVKEEKDKIKAETGVVY
jgi:hypothetical protein